jgi:hypothetical protein
MAPFLTSIVIQAKAGTGGGRSARLHREAHSRDAIHEYSQRSRITSGMTE